MPRLNFSGRKRIFQNDVQIDFTEVRKDVLRPEVSLDLARYDFPADSAIWIEFSNTEFFWRAQFGTVGKPGFRGPSTISGIHGDVPLYARVKINAPGSDSGRILGMMQKVRVYGHRPTLKGGSSESFVAIRYTELYGEVWRLEIPDDENEVPELNIHRDLSGRTALPSDPIFRSLVMPAVLRRILEHIVIRNRRADPGDEDTVHSAILRFAIKLNDNSEVIEALPDASDYVMKAEAWIDDVVRKFSSGHRFVDSFEREFARESA